MSSQKQKIEELLELINLYPSPHNGQPIVLKQKNRDLFSVNFDKSRGLQATDISFIFSFVSMGVFKEHVINCGKALGHQITFDLNLPSQIDLKGSGLISFAEMKINWDFLPKNPAALSSIKYRQTSRKKYYTGVSKTISEKLINIANKNDMKLIKLDDERAHQAIWLNQRAVFDDMLDQSVRSELNHWLRFTKSEKINKKDGLAYDCMELNGRLMKFTVNHPKILSYPIISTILKKYYLATMKDSSDVFYMMAPFQTENQAFKVGEVVMKIWNEISLEGLYLHPFGTIMSNHQAHIDFLKMNNEQNETREISYLVFIFRAGKSKPPVRSLRIDYKVHLLQGAN